MENLEKVQNLVVLEELNNLVDQLRYNTHGYVPKGYTKFPYLNQQRHRKSVLSEGTRTKLMEYMKDEYKVYERGVEISRTKSIEAKVCNKRAGKM